MKVGKAIDNQVKKDLSETIIFGDNAYGISSKDTLSKKEFKKAVKTLEKGISGELWKVKYRPDWADKYPEWLNRILFWLFNNIHFLWRLEKYL